MIRKYAPDLYASFAKVMKLGHAQDKLKPPIGRIVTFKYEVEKANTKRWQIFSAYLVNHTLMESAVQQMEFYTGLFNEINFNIMKLWIYIDDKKFNSLYYRQQIEGKVYEFFDANYNLEEWYNKWLVSEFKEGSIEEFIIDFLKKKGFWKLHG